MTKEQSFIDSLNDLKVQATNKRWSEVKHMRAFWTLVVPARMNYKMATSAKSYMQRLGSA